MREEKEGRTVKMSDENKEGVKRKKTKGKTEENETETVKRRCEGFVSVEAFLNFLGQGEKIWREVVIFLGRPFGGV